MFKKLRKLYKNLYYVARGKAAIFVSNGEKSYASVPKFILGDDDFLQRIHNTIDMCEGHNAWLRYKADKKFE